MNEITQTQFFGDFSRLRSRIDVRQRLQPGFFTTEVESIFRRVWLPVASMTDLPQPNCYVVADVPPLKASLVIARGADGKVRAFHNVCRHRGARLVKHHSGCRKALTCGFHGWTYATDGRLIGVTDTTQFTDFDPEQHGLIPVHAEVWEDYVFVNFDPQPKMTIRQWLGKFHDQYTGFFSNRQRIASYRIVVDANWNLAINSFSEGYHAAYVHRKTVPDYQGGKQIRSGIVPIWRSPNITDAIRRRPIRTAASRRWSRSPTRTGVRSIPRFHRSAKAACRFRPA